MKARYIDLQKTRLIKGEISRRQFMRSALASGLGVSGAMSLASAAEAERPKPGGEFRFAVPGGAGALAIAFTFGNALTELQADGSLTGELAESWDTRDATLWQFVLRKGVTFHNGRDLLAEDVVATLARHRNGFLFDLAEMSVVSPHEVSLRFNQPVPDLPLWLSDPALVIRPASGEALRTGPYAPRRHEDGVLTATRNRDYFKTDRAHFDVVTISASESVTPDLIAQGALDLVAEPTADHLAAAPQMISDRWSGPCRLTQDWAARAGFAPSADIIEQRLIRVADLLHGEDLGRDLPLDGGRIAERWWRA